jgi:hypothetical protein
MLPTICHGVGQLNPEHPSSGVSGSNQSHGDF